MDRQKALDRRSEAVQRAVSGSPMTDVRHRMKERRRNARVGLLGHGHREFRTFGDAVGPALHDALVARVKAHGFLAVRVMIAEQRSLPAPERMPRHRHRTRHVDAHHAYVNLPKPCLKRCPGRISGCDGVGNQGDGICECHLRFWVMACRPRGALFPKQEGLAFPVLQHLACQPFAPQLTGSFPTACVMRDQFDYFGRCLSLPTMFSSRIRLISATVAGFVIKLWPAGTIFSDSAPPKCELS